MANEPTQYPAPVAPGGMRSGAGLRSLRSYQPYDSPRTNQIRNNSMQGAIVGTPGTLPTNWQQSNTSSIVPAVIGTGTDQGIDYIDLRFTGTATGTINNLYPEAFPFTGVAGASGQTWTGSIFYKIVGGSLSNLSQCTFAWSGTNGSSQMEGNQINLPQPALAWQRATVTYSLANAATTNTGIGFQVHPVNGQAIDVTIRFGWPQLETGGAATPPIRTTGAAASRTYGAVRQPYMDQAPRVLSAGLVAGFGAGAGAGILNNGSDADQSQGLVAIRCGLNPGASGTINIDFTPNTPVAGQYVCFADWVSAFSLNIVSNTLAIGWTASRQLNSNENLLLAYQWNTST